ncbi:helix-turn-helix domain-containing protein [Kocuria sp. M4R2S49]|uniref:helix-turn-helix domain-containing protein n=1 Tax=Kocuria rhizosphaericola TaxID=3376284 RepID=UPI00379FDD58
MEYARVSTANQDLDRQIGALRQVGIAPERIHVDKLAYAAHLRETGHTIVEVVAETGITRTTLYRHVPPRSPESAAAGPVSVAESDPGATT